jgi:mono/diheme cytochrome c family protein
MNRQALAIALLAGAALGAAAAPPPSECPQPRFTGRAPDAYYGRENPLRDADPAEGRRLYLGDGRGLSCATCHGPKGDGRGELASQFDPHPRNFACAQTVNGIPDGQLFWVIRFGSPGTAMPPHPKLTDDQVWKLVAYLRRLAN